MPPATTAFKPQTLSSNRFVSFSLLSVFCLISCSHRFDFEWLNTSKVIRFFFNVGRGSWKNKLSMQCNSYWCQLYHTYSVCFLSLVSFYIVTEWFHFFFFSFSLCPANEQQILLLNQLNATDHIKSVSIIYWLYRTMNLLTKLCFKNKKMLWTVVNKREKWKMVQDICQIVFIFVLFFRLSFCLCYFVTKFCLKWTRDANTYSKVVH